MQHMRSHVLNIILFLMISPPAWSQVVVPINELLSDTAYTQKLPIAMAAISLNLDQSRDILDNIEERIELTPEQIDRIDSVMTGLNDELTSAREKISVEFAESSSALVLENAFSELQETNKRIDEFRNLIQTEINEKEQEKETVEKLLNIWEITKNAERTTSLSDIVRDNIHSMITRLEDTNDKMEGYLNNLLELELEMNNLHSEFQELIKLVSDARNLASRILLIPDSDPIWKIYTSQKDSIGLGTRLQNQLELHKSNLSEYYGYNKGSIFLSIFVLIIIQLIFYVLRHRILKEMIAEPVAVEKPVLQLLMKPFFPALLIGAYLVYAILPDKPFILTLIIYLIALLPFTIILLHVIQTGPRIIISLSTILLLAVVSEFGVQFEVLNRTIMLLTTLLGIFLVVHIIYNEEFLGSLPILRKTLIKVAKAILLILFICLIGNIAGNYSLTSILLNGLFSTIFLGISLYLLYLIVMGIFTYVLRSNWGRNYRIIKKFEKEILNKIRRVIIFILTVSFIVIGLNRFQIFIPVYEGIDNFLVEPITLGNFTFSINDIILFILILIITGWISQFTNFLLQEQIFFKSRKQRDLSASISSLVKFGIISLGFFVAALAAGFPLDKMALLISAFGVGIGFGLQNIFNNLVSGIILVFERPLRVGDTIEVGNLLGVVKHIGIRASTVRTYDGAEVIVPNGNIISNELINWTHSDSQRRLILKIGVAYGSDPDKVKKILLGVAKKNTGLLESPEPYVLFKEFGDSALGFELRCYTDSSDWLFILSDLHIAVNEALNKAGIVIPFPQRDLHVKSMDSGIVKSINPTGRTK